MIRISTFPVKDPKLLSQIWKYVAFVVYLSCKEETSMSGIESKVWKRIQRDDVSWVPNYVAPVPN